MSKKGREYRSVRTQSERKVSPLLKEILLVTVGIANNRLHLLFSYQVLSGDFFYTIKNITKGYDTEDNVPQARNYYQERKDIKTTSISTIGT